VTVSQFIPCRIAELPERLHMPAAVVAIEENPANVPSVLPSARALLPPGKLAALRTVYWRTAGVSLGVYFMDGGSIRLKKRILDAANLWSARGANVKFFEVGSSAQAQIRIAFTPGWGYYSYLGTDCLLVPANEQTMNLDSFNDQTSDDEVLRVACHEFGHALGYPHEHQRKEIVALLDRAKTIDYFGRWQGWSPEDVEQQVLTPLDDADLITLTGADVVSIMHYPISGECTISGQAIPGGTRIDAVDYALAGSLYPGSVVVSPPPPSPPPPSPPPPQPGVLKMGVGTFDPSTATWRRRGKDGKDETFVFGLPGDQPVIHDINGDGADKVGVFRPSTGTFYLAVPGGVQEIKFGGGGLIPVVGNW
jgi:hypothetical protein